MLRTFILLLISSSAFSQEFSIKGSIANCTDSIVYLSYGTLGSSSIDSGVIKNGQFSFTGKVSEPVPAMIFTPTYKVRIDLFLDNTNITITGHADSIYNTKVSGGAAVVKEYEAFNQVIMANRKSTIALFQQAYELNQKGDSTTAKEIQAKADSQYRSEFLTRVNYIETHPKSYVGANELLAYISSNTLGASIKLYDALDESIKATAMGKEIASRIELLSKVEPGKQALNFTQQSNKGKAVQLSDYKGRYVLLEFWASWCGPCRAENPNLVQQYKLYKDKGFDVLGVSLDKDKNLWQKAIDKDGLPWTHVSDLNGWNNEVAKLYGIRAVPASFLIDPKGMIIAQGLRGEALNKKLEELFSGAASVK